MYIQRKLREMYCTQYEVTYAHNHTQYALYANTVMRSEWSLHLRTMTQRHHMQHVSDTKCTLCKLPTSHEACPSRLPTPLPPKWFLYIKNSHLLPPLNPSWHKSLPIPLGYYDCHAHGAPGFISTPNENCT